MNICENQEEIELLSSVYIQEILCFFINRTSPSVEDATLGESL